MSAYNLGIPAQIVINTGPNINQAKLKQLNIPLEVMVKEYVPNLMEYIKANSSWAHNINGNCCVRGSIIIPPEKHAEQLENAKRMEDIGAGKVILTKNLTPINLQQAINNLLKDPVVYNKMRVQLESTLSNKTELKQPAKYCIN
ncbi:MAG: hypothetical protein HY929_03695 [Euryarchaeota archaeon]|nr:hypothetical protein [Euryarchaeota archaeon]